MIPDFDERGLLPEGIYTATWEEIEKRFGWNRHRRHLLQGLSEALPLLKAAGVRRLFINGSFVTAKQRPNDIDCCWDISGVDPDALDPVFFDFENGRALQKARFGAEFFPAQWTEGLSGEPFLGFFQVDKATGARKGIIELRLDW